MTHKEYKNKMLIRSFCKTTNNKFFSIKVNGKSVSTTKSKIKFYSSRIIVDNKVFKYTDIRQLRQKERVINL